MYHAHNLLVSCVTVVLFLATVLLRHSHALLVYCVTVVILLLQFLRHAHGLVVFENHVYWTDRADNRVSTCTKYNCSEKFASTQPMENPIGIVVYHSARQPHGNIG